MTILNSPNPDRSISKEDIEKLKSRRYRNRRLGDFLKELDLTEGRSTGVPTIQTKLAENGSPRAIFETTNYRLTFLITIPIHEMCSESSETTNDSSGTRQKTSDKIIELIKKAPQITAPQIAMELGISTRGVEKDLR
mgnify:FL=1